MQTLTIIIPFFKSTSNIALSCKSLHLWLLNNGFPIQTPKEDLCLRNFDYYRSLSFPVNEICEQAARNGDLSLLKFARVLGCEWDEWTCAVAAERGHLEVLKWLREDKWSGCPWDAQTCALVAGGGHLEVLKWARENGCNWDWRTCAYAARGGHLEVLKWARENRCPWNEYVYIYTVKEDHQHILKWLEKAVPYILSEWKHLSKFSL